MPGKGRAKITNIGGDSPTARDHVREATRCLPKTTVVETIPRKT